MPYTGGIKLIDGISPKAGGYPLVDMGDVYTGEGRRLSADVALLTKISTTFGVGDGEIEYARKTLKPLTYLKKKLIMHSKQASYVADNPKNASATYAATPGETYFVTGKSHNNATDYPVCAFMTGTKTVVQTFGTAPGTGYTDLEVVCPEGASWISILTTDTTEYPIAVKQDYMLTGSALVDSLVAQTEDQEERLKTLEEAAELANQAEKGSIIQPTASYKGYRWNARTNQQEGDGTLDIAYSTYAVEGGQMYFATCASAGNAALYPGAIWMDEDDLILETTCDDANNTKYTDYLIAAPTDAVKLILQKPTSIAAVILYNAIVKTAAESAASSQGAYNLDVADALLRQAARDPFVFAPFDKGYVTFVFDDLLYDLDSVASTFEEYGYPMCVAAIPDRLGNRATQLAAARGTFTPGMTMKEICDRVVANGGEIMTHNLLVITEENQHDYEFMHNYFVTAKKTLVAAGYEVRGIIRAGGTGAIKKTHPIDQWLVGNYEYGNFGNPVNYASDRVSINSPLATIQGWIDDAVANNGWLKLMCHSYSFGDYYTSEADLRTILDYVQQSGITVVTYAYIHDHFSSTELTERIKALEAGT